MAGNGREDPLAYGDYHGSGPQDQGDDQSQGGERGFIGDTYRKYKNVYQQSQSGTTTGAQQSSGLASSIFNKLHGVVQELGSQLDQTISGKPQAQPPPAPTVGAQATTQNRFGSFAHQEYGNDVKWYVDGCGYMWAVSMAIEQARESIWILDCEPKFSSWPTSLPAIIEVLLLWIVGSTGLLCTMLRRSPPNSP